MTRLRSTDLEGIAELLPHYDRELVQKTGIDLLNIACRAVGVERPGVERCLSAVSVGIVPVSTGKGIIPGFTGNLSALCSYLGCRSVVTSESDVGGLREAYQNRCDVIMLVDDHHFVAVNTITRHTADNDLCTAKGYVACLALMTGGLRGKEVLVIGCGKVGTAAVFELIRLGAAVTVYDIDEGRGRDLKPKIEQELDVRIEVAADLNEQLNRQRLIVDASTASGIIKARHITADTFVSAPGIPLGLSSSAHKKVEKRLIHDPLQIGASTMLVESLRKDPEGKTPG